MLVSNTGPLLALGTLGLISALRDLYGSVKVTETVYAEITRSSEKPISDLFTEHSWIEIAPDPQMPDTWLSAVLDLGEATTIALSLKENPDRLLIDERKGRRTAESIYNLRIIGTAGILILTKFNRLIPAVRPHLLQLQAKGYYLHPNLIERICLAAGEE